MPKSLKKTAVFSFLVYLVGLDQRIKGRLQAIRLGKPMPSQVM
jgi:hypothetical protein